MHLIDRELTIIAGKLYRLFAKNNPNEYGTRKENVSFTNSMIYIFILSKRRFIKAIYFVRFIH